MTTQLEVKSPTEQWRPVPGLEGIYEISSLGAVKRVCPGKATHVGKIQRPHSKSHYPTVRLCGKPFHIHDLVALVFLGPHPIGFEVNHKDGDKNNSHFLNLEYVTRAQNQQHAERNGMVNHPRGEKHFKAKLDAFDIQCIRQLAEKGELSPSIAKKFGVSPRAIRSIISRQNWRHIP